MYVYYCCAFAAEEVDMIVGCINKQFPVKTEKHKCQGPGSTLLCKVLFAYLKEDDFKSEEVQRREDGMIREAFYPRLDNNNTGVFGLAEQKLGRGIITLYKCIGE